MAFPWSIEWHVCLLFINVCLFFVGFLFLFFVLLFCFVLLFVVCLFVCCWYSEGVLKHPINTIYSWYIFTDGRYLKTGVQKWSLLVIMILFMTWSFCYEDKIGTFGTTNRYNRTQEQFYILKIIYKTKLFTDRHDTVSGWSDMSMHRVLFQWA